MSAKKMNTPTTINLLRREARRLGTFTTDELHHAIITATGYTGRRYANAPSKRSVANYMGKVAWVVKIKQYPHTYRFVETEGDA